MPLDSDIIDRIHDKTTLTNLNYPLSFEFKIGTMANDFNVKDASGNTIVYVRQKMFKLKEAISVFSDDSKTNLLYKINADRVIDFNASYAFSNESGDVFGKVGRRGRKSLLKALYIVFNGENQEEFTIQEENPWAKFFDALLGEVPVLGIFTGYMFNPRYIVTRTDGTLVARLSKQASFFGRKFKLDNLDKFNDAEAERMLLALMMMSLLERRRG